MPTTHVERPHWGAIRVEAVENVVIPARINEACDGPPSSVTVAIRTRTVPTTVASNDWRRAHLATHWSCPSHDATLAPTRASAVRHTSAHAGETAQARAPAKRRTQARAGETAQAHRRAGETAQAHRRDREKNVITADINVARRVQRRG